MLIILKRPAAESKQERNYTGFFFMNKIFLKRSILMPFNIEHSGSRQDFWPWLFSSFKDTSHAMLFSPKLIFAWKDQTKQTFGKADWFRFRDTSILDLLRTLPEVTESDLTIHAFRSFDNRPARRASDKNN